MRRESHELEIMRILWEHEALKPAEIQAQLSYPVKNSALRWQLEALVNEGHVTRSKRGKAYYYRAKTPRQRLLRSWVRRLAEIFSGGSAVALIGQLIESEENLSPEDLRELRRIAGKKTAPKKRSRQRGGST